MKQSNNRKNWYNVKLDDNTQTFIETLRERVQDDYQLDLTKDVVLRALIDHGLRSISHDAINEDPMLLFKVEEVSE
tara:strand:- start:154 stop:381 length:228 start_codon:yes stop_codon:yes gene_type:complete